MNKQLNAYENPFCEQLEEEIKKNFKNKYVVDTYCHLEENISKLEESMINHLLNVDKN